MKLRTPAGKRCIMAGSVRRYLAACGSDAVLTLWDLDAMAGVWALTRLEGAPKHAAFSHDSRYLAFSEEGERAVKVVLVATGAPVLPCASSMPRPRVVCCLTAHSAISSAWCLSPCPSCGPGGGQGMLGICLLVF